MLEPWQRVGHGTPATDPEKLLKLIDRLVERGLGCGCFDDHPEKDSLWREAAEVTGRDPLTGNRVCGAATTTD